MTNFCFRAVLFRMVPKRWQHVETRMFCFRAVLFRMVPKLDYGAVDCYYCFRAVLFRMVPKPFNGNNIFSYVLELCCFEWFQNVTLSKNKK